MAKADGGGVDHMSPQRIAQQRMKREGVASTRHTARHKKAHARASTTASFPTPFLPSQGQDVTTHKRRSPHKAHTPEHEVRVTNVTTSLDLVVRHHPWLLGRVDWHLSKLGGKVLVGSGGAS